jgi:hypothetical protein
VKKIVSCGTASFDKRHYVTKRKKLVKHGKSLGKAIKDLITIVAPRTFARWVSGEGMAKQKQAKQGAIGSTEQNSRGHRQLSQSRLARGFDHGADPFGILDYLVAFFAAAMLAVFLVGGDCGRSLLPRAGTTNFSRT